MVDPSDSVLTAEQHHHIDMHIDSFVKQYENRVVFSYDVGGFYVWSGDYNETMYAFPDERMLALQEPLKIVIAPSMFEGKTTPLEVIEHFKWICENMIPSMEALDG